MPITANLTFSIVKDQAPEIRSLLFRAYKNERTVRALFEAERSGYEQRVRSFIREYELEHRSNQQAALGAFLDGQLVGVALFCEPQYAEALAVSRRARLGLAFTVGLRSAKRYLRYQDSLRRAMPSGKWCYLPLVGVDPDHRNEQIGRGLFDRVWEEALSYPESLGIALGSGASAAASYYTKLGFEAVGQVTLDAVTETLFFRPAR